METHDQRARHCCKTMDASVDAVGELRSAESMRASLLLYEPRAREYGLPIQLSDRPAYERIRYCPWCGNDLDLELAP
jgi:hypothetical protein